MSQLKALKRQAADAVREMRDWLVRDGHTPSEVEVLGRIDGPGVTFFVMRFRLDGDWLLGVAGGYVADTLTVTGHTLTAYEPVTDSIGEDATALITAMDRALTAGSVADGRTVSERLTATLLVHERVDVSRLQGMLGGDIIDGALVLGTSTLRPGPAQDVTDAAERAYLWPQAVSQTKTHTASIIIDTAGGEERARIHTRLVASLLDENVAVVAANGTVYEPAFYRQVVDTTPEDSPAVLVLVHLGIATRRGRLYGFTEGLADVGKDEFLLSGSSPEELQGVLLELASHVLLTGAVIPDDTELTLSTGAKIHLSRQGEGAEAVLAGRL